MLPLEDFQREIPVGPSTKKVHLILDTASTAPSVEGAALVQVQALDREARRIPIPGWGAMSARVFEYAYVTPGDLQNPATTHLTVTPPEGAVSLRFVGHRWKSAVATGLVGEPLLFTNEHMPPLMSPTGSALRWRGPDFRYSQSVPGGSQRVVVSLYARAKATATSPLWVRFHDSDGTELPPPEGLPCNPEFGAFMPLRVETDTEIRQDFSIRIPADAATMHLSGAEWGKKTAVYTAPPVVQFDGDGVASEIDSFVASCRSSDHLIVIDTTAPPLGHDTLALRPNNLALEYVRQGCKVIFIPFGTLQGHPVSISDSCIQVERAHIDGVLNQILTLPNGPRGTYICSSFPSYECMTRLERLKRHEWTTVYEVRDDMEEFNRVGYSKWYHPMLEKRVAEAADKVVTVSTALADKIEVMTKPSRRPDVIPNGVRQQTLDQSVHLRGDVPPFPREEERVVGYVGHLTDSWFDWPAVVRAAELLPEVTIEIVGHGIPETIQLPRNVHYLGPKTHEQLLDVVAKWRVGLIPFIDSPLTRGVDPNKIYEYFAWGLRVVSARMGSVHDYPSTATYHGAEELADAVASAVATPMGPSEIAKVRQFAEASSWAHRARSMLQVMEVSAR